MKNYLKKYFSITAILLVSGCGIWTDFTTYFNLYFNTTQLYEESKEEIAQLASEPFQLKEPVVTTATRNKLTSLQEKTSKILQHESESSYFDDALFISGFAFYYNGDYAKAKRKFQELASLKTEDYDLKSKMWIAKCDLQVRSFESGMKLLEEVKDSALARENEEVLNNSYKIIISYYIDREQNVEAITEARNLIKVSSDDELNALAAYQIGLLYLESANEKEAVKAFESVLEYSPDFATEFNSKFEIAKLKKELGEIEESREMLDDLYNEGKYSPFWGDVYYQVGLIEYEAENYDQAFKIFTDVNNLYGSSKGALQSQLMLGEIMRNVYADYDSAKTYYDKVKGNNTDPGLKEQAELYSQSITRYLDLKKDIKKSDRQIIYVLRPEEFLRDSLAHQKYLATKTEDNVQPTQTTDEETPDVTDNNEGLPTDSSVVADSVETQSSRDSLFAQTMLDFSFDDEYILEEKPEYPTVEIDSLEARIAKDYFALGNLFFTDLIRPDSAYFYYDHLLTEFPNTKYKPRVLFALGAYYETKEEKAKSDSLYSIVYNDYKTYPIANEAAKKLGKPPLIRESDPAQAEFLSAETQIENAAFDSALVILKNIAQYYTESIYNPKSLYTIGWLYENKIDQPDSAAAYYSDLVEKHRNSEYAAAVIRKVSVYQTEMIRQQQEARQTEEANTEETVIPEETLNVEQPDSAGVDTGNLIELNEEILPQQIEPEPVDTSKTNKQ